MKLSVAERFKLLELLPPQGDFTTLKLLRKFRESLSFSEKERAELQFRNGYKCPTCDNEVVTPVPVKCGNCDQYMQPTGQVVWKPEGEPNKDVFIGDTIKGIIASALKQMDDAKVLTELHYRLYEELVGDKEEAQEQEEKPGGD